MERQNFGYSLKNIPVPNKKSYLKALIDKIGNFICRARWKAYFYDKKLDKDSNPHSNNFGFKSGKTPPKNNNLTAFENDLYAMVVLAGRWTRAYSGPGSSLPFVCTRQT